MEIKGGNSIHGIVFKDGGYQPISAHVPCGFSVNEYVDDTGNFVIEISYYDKKVGSTYILGNNTSLDDDDKKIIRGHVASDFNCGLIEKLVKKMGV